jgi:DNA-directed RNA polymerase alpha subunit
MFPAPMLIDPIPDLPDDTEIKGVRLPTRIRNALTEAGVKTIGELRQTSDAGLFSLQGIGSGSFTFLRKRFGQSP